MTSNATASTLLELAARVEAGTGDDNALDVLVEVALFEPNAHYSAIRANAAGTKVIYTTTEGDENTHWAEDWTVRMRRRATVSALRARASQEASHD